MTDEGMDFLKPGDEPGGSESGSA
eukprot:COSAG01_NODE_64185_length_277_cov_0.876404_1_plen_23_part_10